MGTCEEYVLVGLSQQKWCSYEGSGSHIKPWTHPACTGVVWVPSVPSTLSCPIVCSLGVLTHAPLTPPLTCPSPPEAEWPWP